MDEWSKAEEHAERARKFFEAGQLERALEELQRALAVRPDQEDWQYGMGLTLEALERFEEAAACFRRVLDLRGQEDPDLLLHLALAYLRCGESAQAINALERLAAVDPTCEAAYCWRIAAYVQQGEHEQAELMFYLARQLKEHCPLCLHHLAQSLAMRGQWERAAWCWQEVLRLDQRFPGAHLNLARVLWKQGQSAQAYQHYLEELRQDPGDTQALIELGHLLVEMDRLPEAEEKFRRVLELDPHSAPAHLHLAELALLRGELPEAEVALKEAYRLQPDLPGLHLRLAQLAQHNGQIQAAQRYLDAELKRGEHLVSHVLDMARLLIEQRRAEEAQVLLNRQLARAEAVPYPPTVLGAMLVYRGVAKMLRGEISGGIADCRRALRLVPDNTLAVVNLVLAYAHTGRFAQAQYWLQRAAIITPDDPQLKWLRRRVRWLKWQARLLRIFSVPLRWVLRRK